MINRVPREMVKINAVRWDTELQIRKPKVTRVAPLET